MSLDRGLDCCSSPIVLYIFFFYTIKSIIFANLLHNLILLPTHIIIHCIDVTYIYFQTLCDAGINMEK